MTSEWDVVVVGGGQAGLSMGYYLARQGLRFVILDGAPVTGHAWRSRWDSLRLFTPARYSTLPAFPFPGDPEHLPARDEVADYLEAYAAALDLPVRLSQQVTAVHRKGSGFTVDTPTLRYQAAQVVIATGPFQRPLVPEISAALPDSVFQLHSSAYRHPEQLPPGDVLVVGGGNSGVQIAAELASTRRVTLSAGTRLPRLPERLFGRSLFSWLEAAGLFRIPVTSPLVRKMSRTETLIGMGLRQIQRDHGVAVAGRTVKVEGDRVIMEGGPSARPEAVVWATGFRPDYSWLNVPVLGRGGIPLQARGETAVPGLYFLGLPWMFTRGSALIGWVGRDAEHLAERIRARAPRGTTRPVPEGIHG